MNKKIFNFTESAITKLAAPEKGRTIYRDIKEHSLVLMTYSTGSKAFYMSRNIDTDSGRTRYRKKIGDFPDMSVADARDKAVEFKALLLKGYNPFVNEQPIREMTFGELFNKYIKDHAKHSIEDWQYVINNVKRYAGHLYDRKISSLRREDIQAVFNHITDVGKKVTANRFVGRMRAIFNKAILWELIDKNPATQITTHKEEARERYLMEGEVRLFFKILEESEEYVRDFILILLCTGARKGNVLSMRWDEINFSTNTWHLSGDKTKNGIPQDIHLDEEVIEILKRRKEQNSTPWVFPSGLSKSGHYADPKRAWDTFRKKAGLKDFTMHDLRRTLASWMSISGESLQVIGKALNHQSLSSTLIYARLNITPVRAAVGKALKIIKDVKNNEQQLIQGERLWKL